MQRQGALIVDSFVAGTGEAKDQGALAALRPGSPLRLRPVRGRLEVVTGAGMRLGWLPWEDARDIRDPEAARVEVTALVPSRQRARIQVRIAVAA